MKHLHRVIAVGKFEQRWFYVEGVEDRCFVGRYWTRRRRASKTEPHWSHTRRRVSVLTIGYGIPDDSKPCPPKSDH